ncbi:MAG: ATP-binding protein [Acidobacteria bacterium]|nr:ATP-binding protein [Acidobacteriota bacterium]
MGVRRAGKTMLGRSLPGADYFDCELPSVRRLLGDPEAFLDTHRGQTLVLDEVHRLADPAGLLKIAADHYPDTRVLATGSSTLGASARFRDTLAGRKAEVWLTPMTLADLDDFGVTNLRHRLLRGGLPPFFLAGDTPQGAFQEWVDAYWAKDILDLFRLERRHAFSRLLELIMAQSGGVFEATAFARPCEVSRTTIANYVAVLDATFVVHLVRPYVGGSAAEIVAAPRAYAFDTGFVCFFRGWHDLRHDDLGYLWEHLVLNELHAHVGREPVHYWRTKHGAEVDFIVARRGDPPVAIECKWSADEFDAAGMLAFRAKYPQGPNYVVASDATRSYTRTHRGLRVSFVPLARLGPLVSGVQEAW